tara:strand:- start:212 stop:1180 length:969 start_codon:yes stop_codon:yes gene_type:complete
MRISKKLKLIFIFFLTTFLLNCQNINQSQYIEQLQFGSHEYFLNKFGGIYENPKLQNYITSLGNLISNSMELTEYELNFYILNSSSLNIFSSNKNKVYITRGIIVLCNNEAQLAGMLAHQLGHIKANHNPRYKKNYISWNKNLSKNESDIEENLDIQPLKIKLPYYNYFQEIEANKISIEALNKISFSFSEFININKSVKKFLKYKRELYFWKKVKFDIENIHPLSKDDLKKLFNKHEGKRQKNPIKGRDYFLKKIDGTVYENLKDKKIIIRSPKKNESFENFTLNSDITTKKEKELFMILNDLTKEKINSKKKLKIIKENN